MLKRSLSITQGFPMMRFDGHKGFVVAEVSVFDFQRTNEGLSQRTSPINRPGSGVRDVVQKDRQAKRKPHARARG
jgi:hypothetical protein